MERSRGGWRLTPYVVKILPEGERLVAIARFPWIIRLASWGTLTFIGLMPLLFLFWDGVTGALNGGRAFVYLSASVVGVVIFTLSQVHMQTTEFGLTTNRVVYKKGLFTRYSNEIPLRSLENVQLHQNLIGRIFNFGWLEITGSGGSPVKTALVQDPIGLRSAVVAAKIRLIDGAEPIDQAHNNVQEL